MADRRVRVAAVQATPVVLDRDATVAKAVGLIKEAAAEGARLIVFPEAFIPTYPDWVWRTTPWADGDWYERLFQQAVDIPSVTTSALGQAAADAGAYVCMGVNERDGCTLYNTLLYFDPTGSLVGRHRKLMPTGGERLVWGYGDGSGLVTVDADFGCLGGLICWENYMPLARAAMYAMGVEVYVAPTWDNSDAWVSTLRHIAKEGGCYVVGVTPFIRGSDVPRDLPRADELYGGDEDLLSKGNSCVVAPGGDVLAGPLEGEAGMVYADLDLSRVAKARRLFDPVGHYARADVLRLVVDAGAKPAVAFEGGPAVRDDQASAIEE